MTHYSLLEVLKQLYVSRNIRLDIPLHVRLNVKIIRGKVQAIIKPILMKRAIEYVQNNEHLMEIRQRI